MDLYSLAERVGTLEALDRVAVPLTAAVKRAIPRGALKDLLSGTWLGHPLHPLLTDIPIGCVTSTSILDLVGGPSAERAADVLLGLGLLSAVPTAAAGAADWSDTFGETKRIGVVHAASNAVGLTLYALSWRARRRCNRAAGTTLALAGMATMTVGGYLGGHLSFGEGVGVNHTFDEEPATEWTPVLTLDELADGATTSVEANGARVLLHRRGDAILAIASRCTHAGGRLEDGAVDDEHCTVECPLHQSVFRLDDGAVVHGPATMPQTAYDVRVERGRVDVRRRPATGAGPTLGRARSRAGATP